MVKKMTYAQRKAMMARLAQEKKEHEAIARTQTGEYQTSTISVKKRKRRVKGKKAPSHVWGSFLSAESKDRKSGEQGLGPEF